MALLVASLPFSASALAQTALLAPDIFANDALNGIDSLRVDDAGSAPFQVSANPSNPANGFDPSANPAVDRADIPARCDQDPPQFPDARFEVAALRPLGIAPLLLLSFSSSDCRHDRIHERAPPILA